MGAATKQLEELEKFLVAARAKAVEKEMPHWGKREVNIWLDEWQLILLIRLARLAIATNKLSEDYADD